MTGSRPLRVAVVGAGLVGIDLVRKIQHSPHLDCQLVVGRDHESAGMRQAVRLGRATTTDGIHALLTDPGPFDIVFDASDATSHAERWARLEPLGTMLIDLTPSRVGRMVAPTVNGADALTHRNVNLITCGGQVSVPLLMALSRRYRIDYIEVVTTAANLSVGRATRLNLDEYVATTQDAVRHFTGVEHAKAMVNLSPARPPATFRVAMSVVAAGLDAETVRTIVASAIEDVRRFVPGMRIMSCSSTTQQAFIAVEVATTGEQLPRYAGNLDVINSAAIVVAERYASQRSTSVRQ